MKPTARWRTTCIRSVMLKRLPSGLSHPGRANFRSLSTLKLSACCQCCPSATAVAAVAETNAVPNSEHKYVKALHRIYSCLFVSGACALWLALSSASQGTSVFASATSTGTAFVKNITLTSAASGLAAGALHTLCGPDHLAALTPLTIGRNRFAASFLGSLWGLGHSTGQLLLALAFSFLKDQFTSLLPFLERWASTIVGLTLVAIGALGVYETYFSTRDGGDDDSVSDDEEKLREITSKTSGKSETRIAVATFATGILYGLQPDALFVIIPALALPTPAAAFAYCAMFVIGTVLAMGGYTLGIGTASEELCKGRPGMQQNLSLIASAVAVSVGIALILPSFGVDVPLFH